MPCSAYAAAGLAMLALLPLYSALWAHSLPAYSRSGREVHDTRDTKRCESVLVEPAVPRLGLLNCCGQLPLPVCQGCIGRGRCSWELSEVFLLPQRTPAAGNRSFSGAGEVSCVSWEQQQACIPLQAVQVSSAWCAYVNERPSYLSLTN